MTIDVSRWQILAFSSVCADDERRSRRDARPARRLARAQACESAVLPVRPAGWKEMRNVLALETRQRRWRKQLFGWRACRRATARLVASDAHVIFLKARHVNRGMPRSRPERTALRCAVRCVGFAPLLRLHVEAQRGARSIVCNDQEDV